MSGKNNLLIDDKMATVKIKIDKDAHITVKKERCRECMTRPCLVICTAENYQWDEKGGSWYSTTKAASSAVPAASSVPVTPLNGLIQEAGTVLNTALVRQ